MENSVFERLARQHQIEFRENALNCKEYNPQNPKKTYLTENDSKEGKNFYKEFPIFDAAKERHPFQKKDKDGIMKFNVGVYSDMLRSEHLPLNLFIPLRDNPDYCVKVFNSLLGGIVKTIKSVKIEYAPSPKEDFLNDGTSFDVYIEYIHTDESSGILGIEVKYTEEGYRLKESSREEENINNSASKYYEISQKSKLYKEGKGYSPDPDQNILKNDEYRQIWRNHLLAESMLLNDKLQLTHATSIIFYPSKNGHFTKVGNEYIDMLANNKKDKFCLITYEEYLLACYRHCHDEKYRKWLDYMVDRYII